MEVSRDTPTTYIRLSEDEALVLVVWLSRSQEDWEQLSEDAEGLVLDDLMHAMTRPFAQELSNGTDHVTEAKKRVLESDKRMIEEAKARR